jgi:hypothetical protein
MQARPSFYSRPSVSSITLSMPMTMASRIVLQRQVTEQDPRKSPWRLDDAHRLDGALVWAM